MKFTQSHRVEIDELDVEPPHICPSYGDRSEKLVQVSKPLPTPHQNLPNQHREFCELMILHLAISIYTKLNTVDKSRGNLSESTSPQIADAEPIIG